MRGIGVMMGLAMIGLFGCSGGRPPPPPIAPDPPALVVAPPEANEELPRSIRRLVAEQRDEVSSIASLAAELRDSRGRSRALQEARDLAEELSAIESEIASTSATDSDSLDAIVVRLHRLETKTALMHDALRQATL